MSEIRGIHQSDLIIMSALNIGLQRLRDNPDLLDDVFAGLLLDDATKGSYGDAQVAEAKKWFVKTATPVVMSYALNETKLPCVSIGLQESTESEQTHGDVHYVPQEDTDATWPALAGPLTPLSYAPSSGIMVLPADAIAGIILGAGMILVDAAGREYPIVEVLDDDMVAVAANTVADFRGAFLKGPRPRLTSTVESVNFRETYVIGCHVQNQSVFLIYLHAIVLYCLLKYKQDLLEARGLERTTLSSSEFRRNDLFDMELVYSRAIILNGFVRQSWRKDVHPHVDAVDSHVIMGLPGTVGPPVFEDGSIDVEALATDGFVTAEGE